MQKWGFEITNINWWKKLSENELNFVKSFWISPQVVYAMNLPSILQISAFWNTLETDMIIYWVSEDMLSWNINLPLWVSSSLLDLYNTQIAGSNYPSLSKEIFQALEVNVLFWKSQIFETKNVTTMSWKVTTFSSNLPLAWVSIPLKTMREVSSWFSNKPNLIKIIWNTDDKTFENIKSDLTWFNIVSQKEKVVSIQESLENFRKILSWIVFLVVWFLVFVILYSVLSQKQENDKLFFIYRLHWARSNQLAGIILTESIFYILIWSLLIFLANKFFDTNFANQKLFELSHIQHDIKPLNFVQISEIILLHFVLLISISILVNYKSIWKKFEN